MKGSWQPPRWTLLGSSVEEVAAAATLLCWQLQEQALDGVLKAGGGGGGCGDNGGGNIFV